jgi:hypothetical protein
MREYAMPLWILWALSAIGFAQIPTQPPPRENIPLTRKEYQDALEAWKKSDPDLVKDLATGDPTQLRARIKHAAELQATMSEKEIAYYNVMVWHSRHEQAELAQIVNTSIPLDTRQQSVRNDQALVQSELDEVEATLRELPADDKTLRPIYESERANRKRQLENLADQSKILDEIAKGQANRLDLLQQLAQEQDQIVKGWEHQIEHAQHEAEGYKELYGGLVQQVDDRASANAKNRSGRKRTLATKSTVAAPSFIPASLVGTWITPAQGQSKTANSTLELRVEGDAIRGTYTTHLSAPDGASNELWTVEGRVPAHGPLKLHWTAQDHSSSGDMDLTLGSDGRLSIDRHRKSGKTAVPDGLESLMRRP